MPGGRLVFPPPARAIRDDLLRLQARLYADPVAAREMLKAVGGELTLTPRLRGREKIAPTKPT